MKKIYSINGMTCGGCVASVTKKLHEINGVVSATVSLETSEALVQLESPLEIEIFKSALGDKYTVSEKKDGISVDFNLQNSTNEKSKIQQLKPLLLIFLYLFVAAILLHIKVWSTTSFMLDFMGLFYIVFSFFKLLDLKGFPESFRMYDPIAKVFPLYGWVYPFIEIALGLCFLMRFKIPMALVVTIIILGVTTIGVLKSLLGKKSIQCACLGTALKLPMTQATFIENAIMIVMALVMLLNV
ncbi:heavy-metal-associated domain-containing protein [uncultured Maribacter sp.]|uniref:heavy-metal-associated domain-containing protein n=1 Tax=uncultured Maribacter sp. TaxID=431308 RepID=UPI00261A9F83|nr:heavy-metal-associated domain-containing protein [uncultured Maribacter sp.]